MKKPNVLWILTDQQSYKMMGCMGNRFVKTPYMDYLASQGTLFEEAYCTNPVCLPSRFSLLTGHYPGDIGLRSNEYKDEITNFPEKIRKDGLGHMLTAAGYEAVYGGKEHLPYTDARELGFQYICRDERDGLAKTCARYLQEYDKDHPFAMVASFINPHDICLMAISDFAEELSGEDAKIAEMFAMERASVREAMRIPYGMDKDIFYSEICPPLPENFEPAREEPEAIAIMQEKRRFKKLARKNYTQEQWRIHRWAYARLTEQVDREIGEVLCALKKSGKWEDTVIIFTSDHGDMDASHRMEHKTALYQESIKVPMIIKGLEGPWGVRSSQMVINGLDCICTIMDYAGLGRRKDLQGISLKKTVETGICTGQRPYAVIESEYGIAAVSQRFKYVRYNCGGQNEQFYDLYINAGENYNQIHEKRYQATVAELCCAVNAHREKQKERGDSF